MYLILCWSYLNHSLRFDGEKKEDKIKRNCILNRNRNIGGEKNRNPIIFPKDMTGHMTRLVTCLKTNMALLESQLA